MKKKLIIILSAVAVVVVALVLLIPGLITGDSHGTMSVIRMYSENLDGPWDYMATENTRWVQEKSTYLGQTIITIRPIGDFLWEGPEGTFVFIQGPPDIPTSQEVWEELGIPDVL